MRDGLTWVVIASGPSLTAEDCELVRKSGQQVIVTNTTFRLCPWADALFAFDARWWKIYGGEVAQTFSGRKVSSSQLAGKYGAEVIMRRYRNSGASAIALAMDYDAARIVLLGFDMQAGPNGEAHWHGSHPAELSNAESIRDWPRHFDLLAKHAAKRNVEILNASRVSALTCFPIVELSNALR